MRLVKLALISFAVIFFIVFLISLLFPSHIRISRAVNLPNQRNEIFALLKNEKVWHPAYQDSAASEGMSALQRSAVEQTESTLVFRLQQPGRKAVTNGWQLYGGPSSDSLTLQWYMDFRLGWYPWEKFSSLFYERTYGEMMQQGLDTLKKQLIR